MLGHDLAQPRLGELGVDLGRLQACVTEGDLGGLDVSSRRMRVAAACRSWCGVHLGIRACSKIRLTARRRLSVE